MPKPAGPAMDHDDDLILARDPQRGGRCRIEDPVVRDDLHFKVVVARSQRPELTDPTADRLVGHGRWVGHSDAAPFFAALKITVPAVALFHAPARALHHDGVEIAAREFDGASRTDAGRYSAEELIHQA